MNTMYGNGSESTKSAKFKESQPLMNFANAPSLKSQK